MYIVAREDLPSGLSTAQVAHAAFEYAQAHPEITSRWMRESNNIVIVTVPSEADLFVLRNRARGSGLTTYLNREPDIGNQATALVLEPGLVARRLCQPLSLMGGMHSMSA